MARIKVECMECGKRGTINWPEGPGECKGCGSVDLEPTDA